MAAFLPRSSRGIQRIQVVLGVIETRGEYVGHTVSNFLSSLESKNMDAGSYGRGCIDKNMGKLGKIYRSLGLVQ